ncbi:GNAT family acetyltransferase [Ligilactobacillus salitolerans]|uniref:GNAT family acetyltransferase n=1 Tax=Ligilactobacillus salitolerans TaxID=1808352 RepID=A0A401IS16_9LACO|nr:GNAT family N-acetyltransferase [Ligilactobacillus salitolerans]GBG94330.1 GNAT family acetyltransferase [Ligilactobacillus salitolerans]
MLTFKKSHDLDSQVYADAVRIRTEVFVTEQHVSQDEELQGELGPLYFVGYLGAKPVVTARVLKEAAQTWHVQRVAVIKSCRGQQVGAQILAEIERTGKKYGISRLTLGAQDQAQKFYLKQGFTVEGAGFLDAGIPHHTMNKHIGSAGNQTD